MVLEQRDLKAIQSSSIHADVLDFAKAFDKVPHRRLLRKLHYYGIQGPLLTWLESFLTQRFQSVVCEGQNIKSKPSDFWRIPRYSPWPVTLFIIYKRLTRQRAINS